MKVDNKEYVTWELFDLMVKDISDNYKDGRIKKIIGLTRGGLPLAVALSNRMNIPMETLLWQTRDGDGQDVAHLLTLNRKYRAHELLFVDDICDSGLTIKQINNYFPLAMFSTMMNKLPDTSLVDYSPMALSGDEWIVFPWE